MVSLAGLWKRSRSNSARYRGWNVRTRRWNADENTFAASYQFVHETIVPAANGSEWLNGESSRKFARSCGGFRKPIRFRLSSL